MAEIKETEFDEKELNESVFDSKDNAMANSDSEPSPYIDPFWVAQLEQEKAIRARREAKQLNSVDYNRYLSAMKRHLIMTAKVVSVKEYESAMWLVLLSDSGAQILIPFADHSTLIPEDLLVGKTTDQSILRRQRQVIRKCIGAVLEFTVTKVMPNEDNSKFVVFGNHRAAANAIRKFWFMTPGDDGECRTKVGDIISAQVISASIDSVLLAAHGVEKILHVTKMTHRYIPDCRSFYKTGDLVDVMVTDITTDQDDVDVTLSAYLAEEKDFEDRRYLLSPNSVWDATITRIEQRQGADGAYYPYVEVFIDDISYPGYTNSVKVGQFDYRVGVKCKFYVKDAYFNKRGFVLGSLGYPEIKF